MALLLQFGLGYFCPGHTGGHLIAQRDANPPNIIESVRDHDFLKEIDSLHHLLQLRLQEVETFLQDVEFGRLAIECFQVGQGFVDPWRGGEQAEIRLRKDDCLELRDVHAGDAVRRCVDRIRRRQLREIDARNVVVQALIGRDILLRCVDGFLRLVDRLASLHYGCLDLLLLELEGR